MILRSATSAVAVHDMPAHETDVATGYYAVRPTTRYDRGRLELRWERVGAGTVAAVRQHFAQYGQRGIPFAYESPSAALPNGHYSYDSDLTVRRSSAQSFDLSVTLIQALAYD